MSPFDPGICDYRSVVDRVLSEAKQRLLGELEAKGIEHTAHIADGAYEWRPWRSYLNEVLPLLFPSDGKHDGAEENGPSAASQRAVGEMTPFVFNYQKKT